jgi:hypothetical protein
MDGSSNRLGRTGRWLLALLLAGVQIVWASWMLAAAAFKISEYGAYEFVRHYTNWSWMLQTLFYFASAGAPFMLAGLVDVNSCFGDATLTAIGLGFLPLNGVVWSVLVLVSVMLATKAELFTDVLKELAPTWVMLGDSIYHFWPVLALLLYFIAYRKVVYVALNRIFARQRLYASAFRLTVFLLYESVFGTALSFAIYGLLFNPQKVYKTDLPVGLGVLVVLLTLQLINALPLLLVLFVYKIGRRVEYPPDWLQANESDPELWVRSRDQPVKKF